MTAILNKGASATPRVVLAGVDGGSDADAVLATAAACLRNGQGASLHILHVVVNEEEALAAFDWLERGQRALEAAAADCHDGSARPGVTVHIRSGRPWREIVDEATRALADLIVMSTHGRTGAARVVFGSQEELVVRHAPCPVLVVRKEYPTRPPPLPEIEPD